MTDPEDVHEYFEGAVEEIAVEEIHVQRLLEWLESMRVDDCARSVVSVSLSVCSNIAFY